FGGMNDVRFRSPVFPNQRLVIMAQLARIRAGKRAEFNFQGLVGDSMVFSGQMIGVPIDKNQEIPGKA
ncbi:MAG TPA: beta-hydroxyacyl-ACP dehydratase, partial [Planctomycetaceae bacterium]|nr:beta-hydroxyacyl-ACP dehydratase [Planctomycetaceae bacterium]